MKIAKYTKLIKKKGNGTWINTKDGDVYLATTGSIYKAPGLPSVNDLDAIKAILDIDIKAEQKMLLTHEYAEDVTDLYGLDLSDSAGNSREVSAELLKVAAVLDGRLFSAVCYNATEILFYDGKFLEPIADVLNDNGYIRYAVREVKDRSPYIVVKDGFQVLAAIMPVKILNDDYISELQDFELMCIEQLRKDKMRAVLSGTGKEEKQTSITE